MRGSATYAETSRKRRKAARKEGGSSETGPRLESGDTDPRRLVRDMDAGCSMGKFHTSEVLLKLSILPLLAITAFAQTAIVPGGAGQLANEIQDVDTTINVTSSSCVLNGYSAPCAAAFLIGGTYAIDNEAVQVSSVAAANAFTTTLTVIRGVLGTKAAAHGAVPLLSSSVSFPGAIYGTGYPTFAAGCAAAVAAGATFFPVKAWTNVPTQTCAAPVIDFTFGGSIQPASGVVVTLPQNTNCPAAQHCYDISAGGTVAFTAPPSLVTPNQFGAPVNGTDGHLAIQAAVNAVGQGTLTWPAGNYGTGTAIHKPENQQWAGANQGAFNLPAVCATTLAAAGSVGVAIYSPIPGGGQMHGGGIARMCLTGTGFANGQIGIYGGGDPAGIISPSNTEATFQTLDQVLVNYFGTGLSWGNNYYLNTVINSEFATNNHTVVIPNGLVNSGENLKFTNTVFGTAQDVAWLSQGDGSQEELSFFGCSEDYDTGPAVFQGNFAFLRFYGHHFERASGPFLSNVNATVKIDGGYALLTSSSGSDPFMFSFGANGEQILAMEDLNIFSAHPVAQLVQYGATPSVFEARYLGNTGNGNVAIGQLDNIYAGSVTYSLRTCMSGVFCGVNAHSSNNFYTFPTSTFGRSDDSASGPAITINEINNSSTHRAAIQLGNGWTFLQDLPENNTRDYCVFNAAAGTCAYYSTADNSTQQVAGQMAAASYKFTGGVPVTWTIGGTVPTGTCTNGSLYSDYGSSGGSLYVCQASAWVVK
jgi:hypothetical protein